MKKFYCENKKRIGLWLGGPIIIMIIYSLFLIKNYGLDTTETYNHGAQMRTIDNSGNGIIFIIIFLFYGLQEVVFDIKNLKKIGMYILSVVFVLWLHSFLFNFTMFFARIFGDIYIYFMYYF